ncbi:MAG: cobalt-precorrin-5B (C(1))-methyltransferase CbiD [Lachnospiraceae bacterium]|nr:cobalt-precorrin-5B (C(1))-methyltransferase CbiD [Lachnospiraceae bacterium]
MKNEEILIKTGGLSAGYEKKVVLEGVECEVRSGEILVLAGPNGSGKSTLLRTIAGQLRPMAGVVELCGKDMRERSAHDTSKLMSALFTGQRSLELMTCREAVAAGRYPYTGRLGVLSEEDWKKVDAAMERLGASDLSDQPFDGISDGQRQRVLLARALCQEPEVLILDEPASFLDIRYQLELVYTLRSLAEHEGLAVIASLHEPGLIRRCADRVMCLKNGRVDRLADVSVIFAGNYLEQLFDLPLGSLSDTAEGGRKSVPGRLEHYIIADGKKMRCGYTTGSCAALAASGAASRLLLGSWPDTVSLVTPKGIKVEVPLEILEEGETYASCGVRKDAGDDIDATAGLLICAKVSICNEKGIRIEGGDGVGRVTKPGLDRDVGEAAINTVPRRMIRDAVEAVCLQADHSGGLSVTIFVPGGGEAARKTFNPDLGITGGISILGTSGIVEPMSREALTQTIHLELKQRAAEGRSRVILTPGNYGADYIRAQGLYKTGVCVVRCSNFIGEALDGARANGFTEILLAGHIGKMVKVAGGIMNTHSRQADCRRELFCAYAGLAGGSAGLMHSIMECATTDACIDLIEEHGMLKAVMDGLIAAISEHAAGRAGDGCRTGVLVFSNKHGLLGTDRTARELLESWRSEE